jgi:hypothetical protein
MTATKSKYGVLPIDGRRAKAAPAGWARAAAFGLSVALLLVAALVAWLRFGAFSAAGALGIDYATFVDFGRSLLATGTPYRAYQLAGPYPLHDPAMLAPSTAPNYYPPPFALVCAVLTVAPAFLWWAVPIGILAWTTLRPLPGPWTWPLLAACLAWPATSAVVIVGGSTMWAAAMIAAGLRWGWGGPLVLLKPSLVPFALAGIRGRRWWWSLAGATVASLAMLPLWGQWVTAMTNAQHVSLLYSAGDLPLLLLPVVAWAARTAGAPRRPGSRP